MVKLEHRTWAGILGPSIGLLLVLVAILLAPSFNWEGDALSHLGHWFRTDIGENPIPRALVFNSGLILSGSLTIFFAIKLIQQIQDRILQITLLSIVLTGLLLGGVGVFYEELVVGHLISALGFFLSIPISFGLVGIGFLRHSESRVLGGLLIVLSLLSILLFHPWTYIAIWEYIMALISSFGIIMLTAYDHLGKIDFLKIQNR